MPSSRMRALAALAALLLWRCAAAPSGDAPRLPVTGSDSGPGPAIGEKLAPFELPDQDGRPRSLQSLMGAQGLLLNVNRSVVW